jgi:SAM-dependent methyltransferase
VSGVHRAAATGFGRAAAEYERGRPRYAAEAIRALGVSPGLAVLDLAAGTGILTRALVAEGAEVIAVEPVAEMRAAVPEGVRALDGTAEAIPLPDAYVQLVTVGQAFHWFDGDAALREIHRVLRPGGRLALLWNRRREGEPVNVAIEELVAPYRGDVPTHRGGAWRAAFENTTLFGRLDEQVFLTEQLLDADGIADRVASISFIASLPEPDRERVIAAARALASDGPVRVPYRTEVQVCARIG